MCGHQSCWFPKCSSAEAEVTSVRRSMLIGDINLIKETTQGMPVRMHLASLALIDIGFFVLACSSIRSQALSACKCYEMIRATATSTEYTTIATVNGRRVPRATWRQLAPPATNLRTNVYAITAPTLARADIK
jgi:hypothetical protein